MNKHDDPLSFRWIFETPNGIALLSEFVDKFPASVYHKFAAYEPGLALFNKNDFEGSKAILTSLAFDPNLVIARQATDLLDDVARAQRSASRQGKN